MNIIVGNNGGPARPLKVFQAIKSAGEPVLTGLEQGGGSGSYRGIAGKPLADNTAGNQPRGQLNNGRIFWTIPRVRPVTDNTEREQSFAHSAREALR